MKKQIFFLCALFLTVGITLTMNSCSEDDAPTALTLSTLVAGDIDLNGSTAPNNVAVEPTIVATFSTNVDATTATAANITLKRDYDDSAIATTITVSGATITIVPTETLASGALHELKFASGLKSTEGEILTTAVVRTFSTDGFFAPSGMVAHWTFEDNANDQVGSYVPSAEIEVAYTAGRKTSAGKAAEFNGTTSIIEYANGDLLINTQDFSLSFWVKATEAGHGHFIIGLGAFFGFQFEMNGNFKEFKMPVQFDLGDGTSATGGDLVYNGDGKTKDNGGYVGTTFSKENATIDALLKDQWAHFIYVYNNTTRERSFYLNGELVKSQDHDLFANDLGVPELVATSVGLKYAGIEPDVKNELAFGFVQSRAGTMWANEPWGGYTLPGANHFKGQLDDVRIFHKAITQAEILLMYNSEKP
ncbi:MAG: LamG-like jellyroll fold domain-containing protein [Salinivirgaceae bacterium]